MAAMSTNSSTGTDTLVKTVLIFFISLLSFSIGTFVGKKFSDNQHKLVSLEPTAAGEATDHNVDAEEASLAHGEGHEGAETHATDVAPDHEETVVEGSAHKEEEGHTEESSKVAEAAHKDHPTQAAATHSGEEEHGALEKDLKGPKEEVAHEGKKTSAPHGETKTSEQVKEHVKEPIKVSPAVAKAVAANGSGNFTIQVASYATPEEAEKRVSELKSLKFEGFTTAATIKGNLWYRVNVGMFATIKEAQDYKSLLTEKAKIKAAIIQKLRK